MPRANNVAATHFLHPLELLMHKPSAKRESVIEMLEHGGLTEENVRKISQQTDVPEADIWGAGSFYHLIDDQQQIDAGPVSYTHLTLPTILLV